jgi:23S rRNA pseudouridine2605 synthase
MTRINKYLAQCGIASRRNADDMVLAGRVTVNDEVIRKPGYLVDEATDIVRVDGVVVKPAQEFTYIVLNKPAGYVTSLSDPQNRKTVADLLVNLAARIYPVGRLDLDTEGVLLFTNNGELAHRLTHPRYGVAKIYRARVKGEVTKQKLHLFKSGIKLPDGAVGRASVKILKAEKEHSDLALELTEGRKREVKHLCKAVGHPVISLVRTEFAGITCQRLQEGAWRYLTAREIDSLHRMVGLS